MFYREIILLFPFSVYCPATSFSSNFGGLVPFSLREEEEECICPIHFITDNLKDLTVWFPSFHSGGPDLEKSFPH